MKLLFLVAIMCVATCLAQTGGATVTHSLWDRREFSLLYGKRSDPCHIGLDDNTPDCFFNQYPDPSQTIVVPPFNTGLTPLAAVTETSINSFVITGHRLYNGVTAVATTLTFALSDVNGKCSSVDMSTLVVSPAYSAAVGDQSITISPLVLNSWRTAAMIFEDNARSICFRDSTGSVFRYTGFKWKVIYAQLTSIANPCPPTSITTAYTQYPMNGTWATLMLSKKTPCNYGFGAPFPYLQCINSNAEGCCGGVSFNPMTQKCCSTVYGTVQWLDAPCPCFSSGVAGQCPTSEPTCCLPSKFPELAYTDMYGECYNNTLHQCCDSGRRFDAGSQQCCVVNGLQSLDIPCPCGVQTDCIGNFADPTDDQYFTCCMQTSPTPAETTLYQRTTTAVAICSKYANFPSGTGSYALQPCLGSCMDTRYQTCCNGVSCIQNTEYCCNATCCNRYIGTCSTGRRPASPGNWQNPIDYNVYYTQCSTVEQLNTIKAFWIFVLPTELMFASFLCLAVCLAFAAHARDTHEFAIVERVMIAAAVFAILFSVSTFFAPIYKYGVVVVTVSLLAIITAAARVRWLNILCVFFQLVALFYLFDFVDGNYYLELNSNRNFVTGTTDPTTMGVLHSIAKMFPSPQLIKNQWNPTTATYQQNWCTTYYNYFQFDMQVRDYERVDNPDVITFGYCSRAWSVALYLFVAAILDLVILQFILDVLALILRFQHSTEEFTPAEPVAKQA